MHYQVAYDAANSLPAGWWAPLLGPLLFAAGYFVIRPVAEHLRIWQSTKTPRRRLYWGLMLVVMVIWTVGTSKAVFTNYSEIRTAVRTGRFKTAEGRVSRFVPAPYEGHENESFCVDTVCFEYSDYVVTGGFNTTKAHGGPVRDGLSVRVTYVGDKIIKLEIAS